MRESSNHFPAQSVVTPSSPGLSLYAIRSHLPCSTWSPPYLRHIALQSSSFPLAESPLLSMPLARSTIRPECLRSVSRRLPITRLPSILLTRQPVYGVSSLPMYICRFYSSSNKLSSHKCTRRLMAPMKRIAIISTALSSHLHACHEGLHPVGSESRCILADNGGSRKM